MKHCTKKTYSRLVFNSILLFSLCHPYKAISATLADTVVLNSNDKTYDLTVTENVEKDLGTLRGNKLDIIGAEADPNNLIEITGNSKSGILVTPSVSGASPPPQTLNIENVHATGFYRSGDGGFILNGKYSFTAKNAIVNITNSKFTYNKVTSAGGVLRNAESGVMTIKNSVFQYNAGGLYGSADISNNGTVYIENSFFLGGGEDLNITSYLDNSIGNLSSVTITGSTFQNYVNNKIDPGGNLAGGGKAGAINNKYIDNRYKAIVNINIGETSSTTFNNNSAYYGGAIYNDKFSELNVNNATFNTNNAEKYGGAILTQGDTHITNSKFSSNTSKDNGGAIYNLNTLNIEDVTSFTSNSSSKNGGAIYNKSESVVNINANFTKNIATKGYGGAIYNEVDSKIASISGTFTENGFNTTENSSSTYFGGAIYNAGQIETINADFFRNAVFVKETSSSYGGAIYNAIGATINNIGGLFSGNYARGSSPNTDRSSGDFGGAIYNAGIINSVTATFTQNGNATDFGGAIANDGTMTLNGSDFTSNTVNANGDGGAIYNTGTMTIVNSEISDNEIKLTGGDGGAIYNSGSLTLTDVNFSGNKAGTSGIAGAIYNTNTVTINSKMETVTIDGNTASSTDNAIYNNGTLNLNASGNFQITISDTITGDTTDKGIININQSSNGIVKFSSNIYDNTINFHNGVLALGRYVNSSGGHETATLSNLYSKGSTLDTLIATAALSAGETREINMINGYVSSYQIAGDFNITDTNLAVDLNLRNETADNFTFADTSNVTADTGIVLVNIVNVKDTDDEGSITIFYNQETNPNLTLLEKEVFIIDFEKTIKLTQNPDNKGAYNYDVNLGENYNLNSAISFDSVDTQYDMKTTYGTDNGNETVITNTIGFDLSGSYQSKAMKVNGLAGGSNGFNVTSGQRIDPDDATSLLTDAVLTLIDGSTFYSTNVHWIDKTNTNSEVVDITFDMIGSGNNNITFDMRNGLVADTAFIFNHTNIDADFTSNDKNNILTMMGAGTYDFDGTAENLTFNVNSMVNSTNSITNSIVNVNGILNSSGSITDSTINVDTMLDASGTINNSLINVDGTVERSNYDNGVAYTLNNNSTLEYSDLKYLYDGTQTTLNSINFNGGKLLGLQNNTIDKIVLNNVTASGISDISIDVDLLDKKMDTINATLASGDGKININHINLFNDSLDEKTVISFTDTASLAGLIAYTGQSPIAVTPIYRYMVSYDTSSGDFTFDRAIGTLGYNPASLTSTVGRNASFVMSTDISEYVLLDTDSLDTHKLYQQNNQESGDKIEQSNVWAKFYGKNEDVNLDAITIDNNVYGTIIGIDTNVYEYKDLEFIVSVYGAYLYSEQEYEDVSINQNTGIFGARALFNKDSFFTGFTANFGISSAEGTNMYGNEEFESYTFAISNKTGFTKKYVNEKILIQPSITTSYIYGQTSSYINAASLHIDRADFNALQIKPELKLIAHLDNGFTPYISAAYNWNLFDTSTIIIDNIAIPDLTVEPYTELKLGAWKNLAEHFSAFAEFSGLFGGRDGFGGQLGIKYNF